MENDKRIESLDKKIDLYNDTKYKMDKNLNKYYNCPALMSGLLCVGTGTAVLVSVFNQNFDFIKSLGTLAISNIALIAIVNLRNCQSFKNDVELEIMFYDVAKDLRTLADDDDTRTLVEEKYHNIHFDGSNYLIKTDDDNMEKVYSKKK